MGRFTLMDWLGLPTGVVVLIVVLMALFMFWGGEQLERIFGGRDLTKEPKVPLQLGRRSDRIAVVVLVIGQPTMQTNGIRSADEKEPLLEDRPRISDPSR